MSEEPDVVSWLARWYSERCDGSCGHEHHVRIGSTEGAGWEVRIDLAATSMADDVFGAIAIDRTEQDWLRCEIRDGEFVGVCGPVNLLELLERFRSWVAARERKHA